MATAPKSAEPVADKSEPSRFLYGLHFAYRGRLYQIGPEELARCLWTDGAAWAADVAWARQIIDALATKITGKAPSQ
jgi:hypothetical protein